MRLPEYRLANKVINVTLVIFFLLAPLLLIEGVCTLLNRSDGVRFPFFFQTVRDYKPDDIRFTVVDSLLGHTWGNDYFQRLKSAHVSYQNNFVVVRSSFGLTSIVKDGFVFHVSPFNEAYTNSFSVSQLPRPFILVLGGSTSQSLRISNIPSWTEYMAIRMQRDGIKGTVINGALSGYSSNQELLTLLRDGLNLSPNVVISYHGVNEVENVDPVYPLTEPFLQQTFKRLTRRPEQRSSFLPNAVYRIISASKQDSEKKPPLTFGSPSNKTYAENFVKNVQVMDALCKGFNIKYISVLQPFALTGSFGMRLKPIPYEQLQKRYGDSAKDAVETLKMYNEFLDIRTKYSLPTLDFTTVFDDYIPEQHEVYYDWCHVNSFANEYLAAKIMEILASTLSIEMAVPEKMLAPK